MTCAPLHLDRVATDEPRLSTAGRRAAPARQSLLATLAMLLTLAAAPPALAFSDLIVFGDSIVDVGNTQFAAVFNGFPDPAPSSLGYLDGRFTNGFNPADVLNQEIEGTTIGASTFGGDNYAFGGARARNDGDFLPDLAQQVGIYTAGLGGAPVPSDTLVMINVGGNDARDITLGGLTGAARQAIIDDAVSAIVTSVANLQAAGATDILFVGVGNVGAIPEILALGGSAPADGRAASEDLNAAIAGALPGDVLFFDTVALFDDVLANPELFGLPTGLNLTDACLGSGAPAPGGAPICNDFAFFDPVHPTTQVLQVLGDELIAVVPEPGTGLMIGLGLVGLASRRRRMAARA